MSAARSSRLSKRVRPAPHWPEAEQERAAEGTAKRRAGYTAYHEPRNCPRDALAKGVSRWSTLLKRRRPSTNTTRLRNTLSILPERSTFKPTSCIRVLNSFKRAAMDEAPEPKQKLCVCTIQARNSELNVVGREKCGRGVRPAYLAFELQKIICLVSC